MNRKLRDVLGAQRWRNMKIEADAVILDGAVGTLGLFKEALQPVERITGFLGLPGGPDGSAFLLIGAVLAFHVQPANAGRLGGSHVVAALPSDLFLNELALLATADAVDLFYTMPCGTRSLDEVDSGIADNRLSFSARHSLLTSFGFSAPHL